MKPPAHFSKRSPGRRDGFAVLIVFALLVLISLLCIATMRTVAWSRDEIGLIDKKQQARLAATTNAARAATPIGAK